MSDDVLERAETILRTPPHERYVLETTIRDLAAAVRDLRAWQAAAMANHKDFERSQRELHERAEQAEAALAEARGLLERLVKANWNCPDPDCTGEGFATGPDEPDFKPHSKTCQTGTFLAAHPAPAEEGMTREQSQQEDWGPASGAGLARADPHPAPRCTCGWQGISAFHNEDCAIYAPAAKP